MSDATEPPTSDAGLAAQALDASDQEQKEEESEQEPIEEGYKGAYHICALLCRASWF